jgi:hypothetical protein
VTRRGKGEKKNTNEELKRSDAAWEHELVADAVDNSQAERLHWQGEQTVPQACPVPRAPWLQKDALFGLISEKKLKKITNSTKI